MAIDDHISEAEITEIDLRKFEPGARVFAYSKRSAYEITFLERTSNDDLIVIIDGGVFSGPTKVEYHGAVGIPFRKDLAGKIIKGYSLCGSYYDPSLPMICEDDTTPCEIPQKNKEDKKVKTNAQLLTSPIQRIGDNPAPNVVPFRRGKRR